MASGSADGRLLLQTAGPRGRKMGRSCYCGFDVSWLNNHSNLKLNLLDFSYLNENRRCKMRMLDVLGLINLQYNTMQMVSYSYCSG